MGMSSGGGQDTIFNEINITPLTDIFLVLLIIMMVIAPMFQSIDKNINMPEINSGTTVEEKLTTVAITKNSEFFVNSQPTNEKKLEEKLKSLIKEVKEKNVVVKADSSTKSKEIMKVIRAAQAAGYEKLTVAGEPLSKKQQKDLTDKKESSHAN